MLNSHAKTHIGQRKVNEDSYLIDQELGLYIVADGVGGLAKGEIASKLVCNTVHNSILSGETLKEAVYQAHRAVINEIKENKEKQGMATTIVALLFNDNSYDVAWVGDSRVYLWDDGLKLLTRDDSYVELLLENGHIGLEDLEKHPDRNVISQALGIERKNITINTNSGVLKNNQRLLICSDGLYTIAKEKDIIASLAEINDIDELTSRLVSIAVAKGGKDNITLISLATDSHEKELNDHERPHVFREFDIKTGHIIGSLPKKVDEFSNENEEDPNLVDQTQLKDLSSEELDLINSAIEPEIAPKESNSIFPIMLGLVLVAIVGLIGFMLR